MSCVICEPLGRVSVDTIDRVPADLSTDTPVNWVSSDLSADMSIEYRPIVSTDIRSRGSQITQDPPFLSFKREGPTRHRQGILHNASFRSVFTAGVMTLCGTCFTQFFNPNGSAFCIRRIQNVELLWSLVMRFRTLEWIRFQVCLSLMTLNGTWFTRFPNPNH